MNTWSIKWNKSCGFLDLNFLRFSEWLWEDKFLSFCWVLLITSRQWHLLPAQLYSSIIELVITRAILLEHWVVTEQGDCQITLSWEGIESPPSVDLCAEESKPSFKLFMGAFWFSLILMTAMWLLKLRFQEFWFFRTSAAEMGIYLAYLVFHINHEWI